MSRKKRKAVFVFLAVVLALGIQAMPAGSLSGAGNVVYADVSLTASLTSGNAAKQDEEGVAVIIEVKNTGTSPVTFNSAELKLDPAESIAVTGGETGSVTLDGGEFTTVTFSLNIGRSAETGARDMTLIFKNGGTEIGRRELGIFRIGEKLGTNGGSGTVAVMDLVHSISPSAGFAYGQDNTLTLKLKNIGNTVVRNAVLSLTLPDGLSVYNSSNSANLGYVSVGSERTVNFPITVDEDAASKNYAVTVKLTGLSYYNESVSDEKTFYIPVNGSGTSVKNAEIANISVPDQVSGDDEFTLSFDVENRNSADLKDVKISVDVPDGLLNKTRNTFVETSITAGGKKSYSVTLFAADSAQEKAYTLKISLSPNDSSTEDADVTQYASIYVSGVSGEKTPQLMVESYSYGGVSVEAGETFLLTLGLYNTSGSHDISNIKVTLDSEDGAFIPVNSSNSFYIEKLGKKERTVQSVILSVKPNAEQKTTPLSVEMSYEDGAGNAFTSSDVISIPVMQDTRLEVDDIIAPPELYTGMQGYVSVQFYNMGKTTLNNLRITAEGDFDTPESVSYFVGNLESGDSDIYDFGFIPRQGGPMNGKVIFTYEDAAGDQQVLERDFSFDVMEEMPAFNDGMPPEDMPAEGGNRKLLKIVLGIAALLIVGGIIVWRIIRKRKMHREMEIHE
jgi:uncharacterized repeat protein (TIGR01451 family)